MAKNEGKINKNGLRTAGRRSGEVTCSKVPRRTRTSTKWGAGSQDGGWSSLPDCCASAQVTPLCLPEPTDGQATDSLAQNLGRLLRHFGRPRVGTAGPGRVKVLESQQGPSLCSPACLWPLKCSPRHRSGRTRARTHTHTHTESHSPLSVWHTGDI